MDGALDASVQPEAARRDRRQRSVAAHCRERPPASQDRWPAAPLFLGNVCALDRTSRSRCRSGPRVRHPATRGPVRGDGLALLDPLLFHEEIKAGRLVRPFDLWLDEGYGYYLTTHPEDLSNEAVALFRSWLIGRFSAGAAARPPEPEPPAAEAPKLRAAK